VITADVRDPSSLDPALGVETFDVVADFLSFTPDHVQSHIEWPIPTRSSTVSLAC
jgi:hypothetical protein